MVVVFFVVVDSIFLLAPHFQFSLKDVLFTVFGVLEYFLTLRLKLNPVVVLLKTMAIFLNFVVKTALI